jgi:homoserine kinase type II
MAVFTPVSAAQVRALLEDYAVGALRGLHPVAEGVENTNYRLECDGGVFALTLFEKRTPVESLPYCLGLAEHAAARGRPTPPLQRTRGGGMLSTLAGRPAALVGWLPGRWLAEPTAAMAEAAGAELARLHGAVADYPVHRDNPLGIEGWRALARRCQHAASGGADAAMAADVAAEVETLAASWPTDLPRGAVHADYFPDNVLFTGDAVTGVIDLYFACTDLLAYDVAVALNAWGFSSAGDPQPARLAGFLRGYEGVRPLTGDEHAALPRLCRGAAARFTLSRLHDRLHHDPSWAVTPKDPAAFHRRLQHHRWWEARAEALGVRPADLLGTPAAPPSPQAAPAPLSQAARAARAGD